ncbi:MAG: methionine--tRNA ligase [Chitinophagales bacterium]|nr:methionine--tRNA ligase [Chitinophagales bacterium]
MSKPKRYTITAALPYANGPLHVGHIAGAYLPADIYVRYLRLKKEDVAFICGSDEHGAAITIQAKKEGITPREIIDKYHEINKDTFKGMGIDFDIYHRTSERLHYETASQFFLDLYNKGVFEEKESLQFFDTEFNQFLADRYIMGTCPNCSFDKAYGDQCENCGRTLNPTDLIEPRSTLSNTKPELKPTKHWYLPLNQYQDWLKEWIVEGKGQTEEWKKNVAGQCRSWLEDKEGLQPRSITRDLDWGVPVPLPNAAGKVLYVWLDAPIGYISATKQWAIDKGKDWKPYWQDKDTKLVHFIGKDNIVFHCIIFPVILKAAGQYILPTNVPANEFMNLEGKKISTSRNWAVWVHEYLQDFPGKEDVLRYYLCSNAPETKDSEFTWADFQAKNNNELVATLGNFVNRVVVLVHKFFEGKNPQVPITDDNVDDIKYLDKQDEAYAKVGAYLDQYDFRAALNEVMEVARTGNKYLTDNEPWKLIKTDPQRTAKILFNCVQTIGHLSILMEPFMPFSAKKLRDLVGMEADDCKWEAPDIVVLPGQQLGQPLFLFEKVEDEVILKQVEKLHAPLAALPNEQSNEPTIAYQPVKEPISYEDFAKLDLRTGTIIAAEKVEKADKLLKLTVDLGFEQRTIVSGIALHYQPNDIIGKQVTVLVNLAPRKLRGIDSQGMILMAEDSEGKLQFVATLEHCQAGMTIS